MRSVLGVMGGLVLPGRRLASKNPAPPQGIPLPFSSVCPFNNPGASISVAAPLRCRKSQTNMLELVLIIPDLLGRLKRSHSVFTSGPKQEPLKNCCEPWLLV